MKTVKVLYCDAPVTVNCPDKIAATLRKLGDVNRGRFAFVTDHVSGTVGKAGCLTPAVSNILFHRFAPLRQLPQPSPGNHRSPEYLD